MKRLIEYLTILFTVIFCLPANSSAFCPVSFFPGSVSCDGQGEFKWTGPYNPDDVVDPNSQTGVSVKGGCPPYSWSVSGNGYWLENDHTFVSENTVYTDGETDCIATVTVVDKYGRQVSGYLRRPGRWVTTGNTCELPGPATKHLGYHRWHGWRYERIEGQFRQYQSYRFDYFNGTCLHREPPCGNQFYCCVPEPDPGEECITLDSTGHIDGYDRREFPCYWQSPEAWSEATGNYDHSGCVKKGAIGWTSMKCVYSQSIMIQVWQCD